MSFSTFGNRTSDFRPLYGGADVDKYTIRACPECGFAGTESEYSDAITSELADWIRSELSSTAKQAAESTAKAYEHSAKIAERQGSTPLIVGTRYLKAAWFSADENDHDAELKYRRLVTDHFANAFDNEQVPAEARPTHLYLIGEQYRRLGETDEAAKWFGILVHEAEGQESLADIAELTRRQMLTPRDSFE